VARAAEEPRPHRAPLQSAGPAEPRAGDGLVSVPRDCRARERGRRLRCAGQTGAVQRMKESYGEGVVVHTGPESCAGAREGEGEALTGESAGRVLSRESAQTVGCRRSRRQRKATLDAPLGRGAPGPHAVEDPAHARTRRAREPGDPASVSDHEVGDRLGKSKDARRGWTDAGSRTAP